VQVPWCTGRCRGVLSPTWGLITFLLEVPSCVSCMANSWYMSREHHIQRWSNQEDCWLNFAGQRVVRYAPPNGGVLSAVGRLITLFLEVMSSVFCMSNACYMPREHRIQRWSYQGHCWASSAGQRVVRYALPETTLTFPRSPALHCLPE
jgi:hypothetical protein